MITIDHSFIKDWIEKHHGKPRIIDDPSAGANTPGLSIDFPGSSDDIFLDRSYALDTNWEKFFNIFENQDLAFEYDSNHVHGDITLSYRFVKRANEEV